MIITDELLFAAAEEAAERYLSALPARADCSHVFSPEFEERMQPLLHRGRRPAWKRALLLAAVVAALTAGLYAGADRKPAYRVDWSQGDGFVSYAIRAERNAAARFQWMTPEYVPDGYVLQMESAAEQSCTTCYRTGDGAAFTIQQETREKKTGVILGEDFQTETVDVEDQEGILVQYEDGSMILLWTDGPNILELYSNGTLTGKDVLKIAENMKYRGGNRS